MIIIIGLGNPGKKYEATRHNVGFMAINKFAEKNSFPEFVLQKKLEALISENIIDGEKIILAKPQTFMNESGKTARALTSQVNEEDTILIVAHDDIDLPVGRIKIIKERGSAGHKGVDSIVKSIGNKGLIRIRIGIGKEKNTDAMKIVLKKFSFFEKSKIKDAIQKTVDSINLIIKENLEKAMNEYNK